MHSRTDGISTYLGLVPGQGHFSIRRSITRLSKEDELCAYVLHSRSKVSARPDGVDRLSTLIRYNLNLVPYNDFITDHLSLNYI